MFEMDQGADFPIKPLSFTMTSLPSRCSDQVEGKLHRIPGNAFVHETHGFRADEAGKQSGIALVDAMSKVSQGCFTSHGWLF